MKGIRLAAVIGLVGLIAACGKQLSDTEHVNLAQQLIDQEELRPASIELKNALAQNPNNPEARRLLGVVQWRIGNYAGAEKELRRARELGVADAAILPLLAKTLFIEGKYDALAKLSPERMPAGVEQAEVLAAQGLGELASNNREEAGALLDRALSSGTGSNYVKVAQARLLAATDKKNRDEAYRILKEVVAKDESYAPAWSLLGQLYRLDKRFDEAEAAFTKAIEHRTANSPDYLARLLVRIDAKQFDLAKKDLDVLLKRVPRNPTVQFAQGRISLHDKKLDEAKGAFELSLRADNRKLMPKYYLALVNLRLGNIQQAENYGEQAYAAMPQSIAVRELLAAIKLRLRDYGEVEKLVRPIVEQRKKDVRALDLLSLALLAQERAGEAVPLLRELTKQLPDSALAEARLGVALLAAKKPEEGLARLENALQKGPIQRVARLVLLRYYLANQQQDKARAVAESYHKAAPESPEPWILLGGIEIKAGNEAEAIKDFEKALEVEPGNPVANQALAGLAAKRKDYDEARRRYQDTLAHHEKYLPSLIKLALLDALEKKEQDMVAHLERAMNAHPKAAAPRVMLARYHLLNGEPDKVAPLLVPLGEGKGKDPAVKEVMALAQLALGQFGEARFNLDQLVKIWPNSAQLHLLLAKAYAGERNVEETKQELQRVVQLEPKALVAHLALARLALRQGDREAAQKQLATMETIAPQHPDVLYLKAVIASAEGQKEEAGQLIEQVFEKAPNTKTMLALAKQKWALGRPEDALALQEEWVAENPDDLLAELALSGALMEEGQADKALERYRAVLKKDPNNVVALNDLAWYMKDSDPQQALKYAQKAAKLAPEVPQVLDTLAMVQMSAGQYQQAERTLRRALLKVPGKPAFQYHLALIKKAEGSRGEAIELLRSVLAKKGNFAEREQAKKVLAELERG